MVYLQYKKIKDKKYLYLIKNIRINNNKWKKINKYIGYYTYKGSIPEIYLENREYFVEEEYKYRMNFLKEYDLTHNPNALPIIVKSSIEIENIKSIDPMFKDSLNRKFIKEFIFNSNQIEGSRIPKEEIEKIIDNKKSSYQNRMEIKEVENSILALEFIENKFTFTTSNIKTLYRKLTKDLVTNAGNKYPGGYKRINNVVNNMPTTPFERVPEAMENLIKWYKKNKKKLHPIRLAFEFHLRFEKIHPFEDGNGRTGRMLMNKILIDNGFSPMIVFTANRVAYFGAIATTEDEHLKKYFDFMIEQYRKTIEEFYNPYVDKYLERI